MGFIDDLKINASKAFEATKEASKKASEKAKDIAQQGKLNLDIVTLDNKIKDKKLELANVVLEKNFPIDKDEKITAILQNIEELQGQKEAKRKELESLK